MRVAVFGSGGVGGYFGARLAQSGEEVIFIARGEHLRAIRERGLRVDSPEGNFVVSPAQVSDDPAAVGTVEVILLGVKAWQVPEAAWAMRPMVGASTFVVPLQNGVEAPMHLASVLGNPHVLGGLCHISVYRVRPGYIRHAGIKPHIAFGELDNHPSERAERLRLAFERAGVWAEIPADIHAAMWEKFLFIASLAGIGAVTRAPAGAIRYLSVTRELLEGAMQEIARLAKAKGVHLPADVIEKTMAYVDSLPENATTSMQRDIVEGRPSELADLNGAVVRLGREVGIDTPIHAFIFYTLLLQEKRARGELTF